MRLHHALEMLALSPDKDRLEIKLMLNECPQTAQFDFGSGDITPEETNDLFEYALELMQAGLFQLPFDSVCYSFQRGIHHAMVVAFAHDTKLRCLIFLKQPDSALIICAGAIDLKESGTTPGKFGIAMNVGDIIFPSAYADLISEKDYNDFVEGQPVKNIEARSVLKLSQLALQELILLTCMLQAKGVETRLEPAPVKLNKARAKKGRLPIQDIRTVLIRVGDRVVTPSGHDVKGTHASPRLHWRRGHIRHFTDGSITNVRPCLVGDPSLGEVKHEGYVVRRSKASVAAE